MAFALNIMRSQVIRVFTLALTIWSVAADNGKYDRRTPARGSIVVDASGSYQGSYKTISAGVSALTNTNSSQIVFILPGTYTEQVYIPPLAGPLTIQGFTPDARTYAANTVTLTYNLSRKTPGLANNDATATLRLWNPNTKIYNLNIYNTFGQPGNFTQALALSAQKTNQAFYACKFEGYQDTIYANEGRQIYAKTYINGAVDFIFGVRARAWFQDVDIEAIGPGYITANGRDAQNNTSIYVINQSKIFGNTPNSTVLGRPWRMFSRVVVQKSYLGDVVKPEGWSRWDSVQNTEDVVYEEYKNFGPGSIAEVGEGVRVDFAEEIGRAYEMADLFGKGYKREGWVDGDYL